MVVELELTETSILGTGKFLIPGTWSMIGSLGLLKSEENVSSLSKIVSRTPNANTDTEAEIPVWGVSIRRDRMRKSENRKR